MAEPPPPSLPHQAPPYLFFSNSCSRHHLGARSPPIRVSPSASSREGGELPRSQTPLRTRSHLAPMAGEPPASSSRTTAAPHRFVLSPSGLPSASSRRACPDRTELRHLPPAAYLAELRRSSRPPAKCRRAPPCSPATTGRRGGCARGRERTRARLGRAAVAQARPCKATTPQARPGMEAGEGVAGGGASRVGRAWANGTRAPAVASVWSEESYQREFFLLDSCSTAG